MYLGTFQTSTKEDFDKKEKKLFLNNWQDPNYASGKDSFNNEKERVIFFLLILFTRFAKIRDKSDG